MSSCSALCLQEVQVHALVGSMMGRPVTIQLGNLVLQLGQELTLCEKKWDELKNLIFCIIYDISWMFLYFVGKSLCKVRSNAQTY